MSHGGSAKLIRFSRLARRLSLWFTPFHEYSRYGLPLAADGRPVASAVLRLLDPFPSDGTKTLKRLLAIWAGEISLEAEAASVREIQSLLFQFPKPDTGGLDVVLGLEICGALAADIDDLDVGTIEALFEAMKSMHAHLDDGRPATAVFRTWLVTWSERGERFRLAYDPSEAFGSAMFSESNGEALEPLLTATVTDFEHCGHAIFAKGPLPIRGILFRREGPLFEALSKQAPEAADLYLLLSEDGDYNEINGPFGEHWYWTGEGDPHAVIFPDAIDRAGERGDHALCDMLIGSWTLFCTLYHQAPLPDLVRLAQRINALPTDYRSSTYAVLALLKREAEANARLRRDLDALLSWLPIIAVAPAEDFGSYLEDVFSPKLWGTVADDEKRRLQSCEESFVWLRRLSSAEREANRIRLLVIDWSAVAESFLGRVRNRYVPGRPSEPETLGVLIGEVKRALIARSKIWSSEERPRMHAALDGLDVLGLLNTLNTKGGKHLGGTEISWTDVVYIHAGLYRALRALLDVATRGGAN
jgi:hypothetical protein